ncbi:hypothetical protein ABVF67_004594 [Vibrio parahaemolyticus]|uniref:hypothetical protein n=1 Tax=Vibrio parahaemolyticus TaxID=670 RepID=UPI0004A28ABE|nr:hypothetical protein [Vibrio parahaemolyticus]HAS8492836.1 hypothetical protein [Vibrio vulnificus]EGR1569457.1 hypothetical protein [Vibrio parahaemolyticus]EJC7971274.1 hypothetical protein [Vibrio parahaemolyticus]MDF4932051.1 hypothetical protein [Vibrio parahaemolyticus]OCP91990.1 hypothetical protein AKH13_07780 [Vibrio parahaemolyticus]
MSWIGDLSEIARELKQTKSKTKILLICLAAFVAIGPLFSLAETVFQARVFVNGGVEFYKHQVVDNIQSVFQYFGFNVRNLFIDCFFLMFVLGTSIVTHTIYYRDVPKENQLKLVFEAVGVFSSVFLLMLIQLYLFQDIAYTGEAIIISILTFIFLYPFLKDFSRQEKIYFYAPILIATSLVCIVAAVRIGFAKSV